MIPKITEKIKLFPDWAPIRKLMKDYGAEMVAGGVVVDVLKEYREEKVKKNFPKENLSQKIGNAFDKKDLAERIIDVQPCWYDKSTFQCGCVCKRNSNLKSSEQVN